VAGSSLGAWVGAWTALGHDADAVEALLRDGFDEYAVHAVFRQGGPQGTSVMTRLARESTNDASFRDLEVPLTVLAADLAAQRPATISDGPVAQALVAAMTMPGRYPPVLRGDQRLVDAVVLTPVPTAALAGVDVTVAVNLLGRPEPPATAGTDGPRRGRPDRDPVVEALELGSQAAAEAQTAEADVPVTPAFGPGTWGGFENAQQFLEAGEQAMEAALPALAALAGPPPTSSGSGGRRSR
jgi:NTE family protein